MERDELEEIGAMQNVPAGFRSILPDWGVRADGEPGYLRPGWRKPLMKYRFANPVSLCVATIGSMGTIGQTQEMKTAKSAAAFSQLSSLVGEWKGVDDGTDFTVTYTLVASSSTLMEEFRPAGGSPMMTMFSVDGDRLLATHYCSALNQPNMSTQAIRDPTDTMMRERRALLS